MTIVECINPFNESDFSDKLKKAVKKGAPVPKIGEHYEVEEFIHYENVEDFPHLVKHGLKKYNGYILKGLDYSKYNLEVAWRRANFKVVKEEFVPNSGTGYETVKMRCSFNFNFGSDDFENQNWGNNEG